MNRKLWKLEGISEKIWLIASSIAMEASRWGTDGRGFAVVAEETRSASLKIKASLEKGLFEQEDINSKYLSEMATELSYLALNAAIEASRSGYRGKAVAICAEDIANLVTELIELLDDKKHSKRALSLIPNNKMTSVDNWVYFMRFTVNGYRMIENMSFVQEVVTNKINHDKTHVKLRNTNIPIIDCFSLLGVENDNPFYLILRTPWAKVNEIFAVSIDELSVQNLFGSSIGIPVTPNPDMPLSKYVRECWESTDSEPFRFMDWPKMIDKGE